MINSQGSPSGFAMRPRPMIEPMRKTLAPDLVGGDPAFSILNIDNIRQPSFSVILNLTMYNEMDKRVRFRKFDPEITNEAQ